MKPFDFNVHPDTSIFRPAPRSVDQVIRSEFELTPRELLLSFQNSINSQSWTQLVSGCNCMIFTAYFHEHPFEAHSFISDLTKLFADSGLQVTTTFLVDPRFDGDIKALLKAWTEAGVRFIKFHSYHQKIGESLYPRCLEICSFAQTLGLGICIDCSYGTIGMFKYDNLLLVSLILDHVKHVPVVILHAGGLRAFEAALLADDASNAFVELSFSPIYYRNTSIYGRFVDIMSLLPPSKFLYASDYPYVDFPKSLASISHLLAAANYTPLQSEAVLLGNIKKILASPKVV